MAVRFAYEWHDDTEQWFRIYGNKILEFNGLVLMQRLHAIFQHVGGKAVAKGVASNPFGQVGVFSGLNDSFLQA